MWGVFRQKVLPKVVTAAVVEGTAGGADDAGISIDGFAAPIALVEFDVVMVVFEH